MHLLENKVGQIVSSSAGTSSGARDTAITFFTRLTVMAASLGVQSALAWLLGPSGRGSYAVCTLFAMLLGVVFTLSVDRAGQYFIASGRTSAGDGIATTMLTVLIGSFLGVAVGYALIGSGAEFFTKASRFAFRFSLLLVPLNVLADSLTLLLMGMRRFGWMSRMSIARVLVHLTGTLVFVWVLDLDVPGALAALMLGNLVAIVMGMRLISREQDLTAARLSPRHCAAMLSYGARYWVANLSNTVHFRIGTIILAWFVSSTDIGLFAAASALVARVLTVPDALESVLLPRVALDPEGRPELVARVARLSLIVCGLILVAMVAVSRPLVVVLFSSSFLPVVPLIGIISVGILLRSGSKVLMPYFMGIDRPAVCSWAVGLATATNLGTLLLLLPVMGLRGAAWAMTVGYVVSATVLVLAFRKASGMGFSRTWRLRRDDVLFLRDIVKDWLRGRLAI